MRLDTKTLTGSESNILQILSKRKGRTSPQSNLDQETGKEWWWSLFPSVQDTDFAPRVPWRHSINLTPSWRFNNIDLESCGLYWCKSLVLHVCCVLSHSVVSNSVRRYGLQSARLLCSWDSQDKNTGVDCHALLQGIFLTQGMNLHWQVGSLPSESPGTHNGLWSLYVKNNINRDICTLIFTAALFKTAKRWKQPKCPLTDEWINKMQ